MDPGLASFLAIITFVFGVYAWRRFWNRLERITAATEELATHFRTIGTTPEAENARLEGVKIRKDTMESAMKKADEQLKKFGAK